ncbi:conserved hypothetical protein [Frankia sp. Hr75.2]|nr:conserved hypothetical protein [Frankia sp. Hr75.2]
MTTTIRPALTADQWAEIHAIADQYEPAAKISVTLTGPDGGTQTGIVWTRGGQRLGDKVDAAATTRGLGLADSFALTEPHGRRHTHDQADVLVTPIRPVLAEILAGKRDDGRFAGLPRALLEAARRLRPDLGPLDDETVDQLARRWEPLGPTLGAQLGR